MAQSIERIGRTGFETRRRGPIRRLGPLLLTMTALVPVSAVLPSRALAVDHRFTPALTTDNSWFLADSWTPATVPTSADYVLFYPYISAVIDGGAAYSGNIDVSAGQFNDSTFKIINGGSLTTTGDATIGMKFPGGKGEAHVGLVLVDGVGSRWDVSGTFTMGHGDAAPYSNGSVTVSGGGTLTTGSFNLVGHPFFETPLLVTGAGSTFVSGNFTANSAADRKDVTFEKGATVISDAVVLGTDAVVTDAGTSWTTGHLQLGQMNDDRGYKFTNLQVLAGAHVNSESVQIGANYTAYKSTMTVDGAGSQLNVTHALDIGVLSTQTYGVLQVSNGGLVTVGSGSGIVNMGNDPAYASQATLIIGGQKTVGGVATTQGPGDVKAGEIRTGANATIQFQHTSQSYVFTPKITGTGKVTISAGSTTLSAANTYSGGTLIEGGVAIGTHASFGTGTITDRSYLVLDQASDGTLTNLVQGTGRLIKRGTGAVTLSAANTYSGGTTIEKGTLIGTTRSFGSNYIVDDGTLVLDQATSSTLANYVAGSGTLIKRGTGSVTLGTTNAYTGGTTISAGALIGTNTSFGTGAVVDNAKLVFDQATSGSFANAISGTGQVIKRGTGSVTLSGINTYSGGTTISAGALIGTTASFGSSWIVDDAKLVIDQSTSSTLANYVAGSGQLIKRGTGSVTLGTNNTYTGGTTISAGALIGTNTSFGSNWIVDDAKLVIDQTTNGKLGNYIAGSGQLIKRGSGTVTLGTNNTFTGGTTISAGGLTGTTTSFGTGWIVDDAALTIDQSTTGTLTNYIAGTGSFTKQGTGTVTVSSNNALTGPVTVAAGKLLVNGGFAGTATVQSGATLGGTGQLGAISVQSGGTLAPGNSIGTIRTGDVTFASGSTYAVEIASNGSSDKIQASGVARLNGGTVAATALDPATSYQNGATYTILNAAGGRIGTFDAARFDSAFVTASLSYTSTAVGLVLTPVRAANQVFAKVAVSENQTATTEALQTLPQEGATLALYNEILSIPTEEEARTVFDYLSGEVHASVKSVEIENSQFLRSAVYDRLIAARDRAAPAGMSVAPLGAAARDDSAVWLQGFGAWGSIDGTDSAAAIDESTGGFFIGADTLLADSWRLGVLGGYSHTSFTIDDRASSGSIDSYHAGVYAGTAWGALALRTGAAYTWNDVSTARSAAGLSDPLDAGYNAGLAQAFGELGYGIPAGRAAFEPFAGLAYVNLDTGGIAETGGATALYGASEASDVTFTTLGLRASTDLPLGALDAGLKGMAGWRHAFGDTLPSATLAYDGSSVFSIGGAPIAEDALVLEAGLDVKIDRSAVLGIAYSGQFAGSETLNAVQGNLAWSF